MANPLKLWDDPDMAEVKKLTEKVVAFRDARDWKQFHNPKDSAISLMLEFRRTFFEEGNEVAREIASNNRAMIFQTVVLGLYSHLMRGKIKKGDPLYLLLQKYLIGVHNGLIKLI